MYRLTWLPCSCQYAWRVGELSRPSSPWPKAAHSNWKTKRGRGARVIRYTVMEICSSPAAPRSGPLRVDHSDELDSRTAVPGPPSGIREMYVWDSYPCGGYPEIDDGDIVLDLKRTAQTHHSRFVAWSTRAGNRNKYKRCNLPDRGKAPWAPVDGCRTSQAQTIVLFASSMEHT